jgi:CHAT domain-containing protein
VFISDGLFRNIPMSALYTGEQYLIERYAIAVAPSLKLLDSEGLSFLETIKTLVAGASDAPSFTAEGRGFLKILNVKREIDQIENALPNHQKIVEADFTKLNFQNKLKSNQFSIIHLATHGKFSSNPENTFILAWDDKINIRELKSFFTQNVKISRPIELLVLSACQTAKGDNRAALGLAGVAVQAGTRSTLASLWHVDDFSTARLMTEFYTTLKQLRTTKAEALRQAQLSLLKNPEDDLHMRPYYWAPFTIIGNWV